MTEPCVQVTVRARREFDVSVIRGLRIEEVPMGLGDGIEIISASPVPSIVTLGTSVRVIRDVDSRVEYSEKHVLVRIDREWFVYPRKIWDLVYNDYILPMIEGKPPKNPGLLLYGPPGTGKTTMARIISSLANLTLYEVGASNILRKYVGESEMELSKVFDYAESSPPSMILFDDAEWLVRARKLAGEREGTETVSLSLMSELLRRIERWGREGVQSLCVVTTNAPPELIDPALLRSGRLGKPLLIPLPDHEAIRLFLEKNGVGGGEAEKLASFFVSLGACMADVVSLLPEVRERGLEARERIEDRLRVASRGYLRLFSPFIIDRDKISEFFTTLFKPSPHLRLHVALEKELAIPILATVFTSLGIPTIYLFDLRFADEAIETAEMLNGIVVIDSRIMTPQIAYSVNIPVVSFGSSTEYTNFLVIIRDAVDIFNVFNIPPDDYVDIVGRYYGCSESVLKRAKQVISMLSIDQKARFLKLLSTFAPSGLTESSVDRLRQLTSLVT